MWRIKKGKRQPARCNEGEIFSNGRRCFWEELGKKKTDDPCGALRELSFSARKCGIGSRRRLLTEISDYLGKNRPRNTRKNLVGCEIAETLSIMQSRRGALRGSSRKKGRIGVTMRRPVDCPIGPENRRPSRQCRGWERVSAPRKAPGQETASPANLSEPKRIAHFNATEERVSFKKKRVTDAQTTCRCSSRMERWTKKRQKPEIGAPASMILCRVAWRRGDHKKEKSFAAKPQKKRHPPPNSTKLRAQKTPTEKLCQIKTVAGQNTVPKQKSSRAAKGVSDQRCRGGNSAIEAWAESGIPSARIRSALQATQPHSRIREKKDSQRTVL